MKINNIKIFLYYLLMSNEIIINEFEKLVKFIQFEIDHSKNVKDKTSNTFRIKQNKNILAIIKKYPHKITLDNLKTFGELPGIGKGTLDRIKEILETGKLKELLNFNEEIDENDKLIKEFETIVGVGRTSALKFIDDGITSVEDLKKKVEKGKYDVNDKIKLGLKYYGIFEGNIPRKEIDKVYKLIESIIKKMNKKYKYDDSEKYIFEICGSYRRESPTSGDIDVLISKLGSKLDEKDQINHLERFVKMLKDPIKTNDDQPLLVDDITDKHYETKYMGFAKYKDNPFRRIDIRYVPHDVYYSALLYFTGSATLNVNMRKIAEKMGLKLSEYGLTKEDGSKIPIETEYDIFKILKLEYLAPRLR
jgi:DNA polymerase/3'-5' exonuclease PolX